MRIVLVDLTSCHSHWKLVRRMLARRPKRRHQRVAPVSVTGLQSAEDRFLAVALDRVLAEGFRSPHDFVRHFSPAKIGRALATSPKLRSVVLGVVAGYTEAKAERQTVEQTGAILDEAFAEGDATPEMLLQLLTPADWVRHLDPAALWHFVVEHRDWRRQPRDTVPKRRTVSAMLGAAVQEGLLSPADTFSRIGPARLALWLPPALLAKLIEVALERGTRGQTVDADTLARAIPLPALARAVPPSELLDSVLIPLLHARMVDPRARRESGADLGLDQPPHRRPVRPSTRPPSPPSGAHHASSAEWRRGWEASSTEASTAVD
ncbi:MAG: hypothetical protein B7733_06610 [Myxococcales bacterium FL481]|nr:MAG: hypothetical protein B7733_06610 [Myxococcales bacterium FL481]